MVTSRRLQAAASAEARRLIKRRDRISQRIAPLRAEIDAIDERIALIEKAAGLALAHVDLETPPVPAAVLGIPLVGKAIRVQAVRSMLDRYPLGHAAHAREWFAAYRDDGYAVVSAGAVPPATVCCSTIRRCRRLAASAWGSCARPTTAS